MYLKLLLMVIVILRYQATLHMWLGKHGIIKQIIDTEIDWNVWGLTSLIGVGANTLGGQTIVYIASLFVNFIISGLIELVLRHSYILIYNINSYICNILIYNINSYIYNINSYICRHKKNEIEECNIKNERGTRWGANHSTGKLSIATYETVESILILLSVLIGGSIGRNIAISIF